MVGVGLATHPGMYADLGQVRQRVKAFEECTIAPEDFDHRAHLTVACWYAHTDPDDPLARVRRGIQRFNAYNAVFTTPTRGYHETITRFWMTMVCASLYALPETVEPVARINRVVDALADKMLVLEYYSRDVIMTDDARYGWVEPDRKPLPPVNRPPLKVELKAGGDVAVVGQVGEQ